MAEGQKGNTYGSAWSIKAVSSSLGRNSIDGLAPLGFGWPGIVLGKRGGLSPRFSKAFRSNSGG